MSYNESMNTYKTTKQGRVEINKNGIYSYIGNNIWKNGH